MCKIQTYQILQYVQFIIFPLRRLYDDSLIRFLPSTIPTHTGEGLIGININQIFLPDQLWCGLPHGVLQVPLWQAGPNSEVYAYSWDDQDDSPIQSNPIQWWCWCRCVKWRSPPSPSLLRCRLCLQLKTETWISLLINKVGSYFCAGAEAGVVGWFRVLLWRRDHQALHLWPHCLPSAGHCHPSK